MSAVSTHEESGHGTAHLSRNLGLWAIVALGLGYMTPTVIFDTFGIVSDETNGVVPSAYVLALVAMTFTAISYGRMTRIFPSAGSAYTYTSNTMSPKLGFLIGWSSLLDYLLLPLVNALIIRSYMEAFFPDVPPWIWVSVYVVAITAMCLFSMSNTSRVNGLLVVFEVVLIAVFIVLAWRALAKGDGNGAIFFVAAWFTQSLFPTIEDFSADSLENSALPEIAFLVGGTLFKILLTSAAFAATAASSLASHASVSRLLYVMGRNGTGLIGKTFGAVHPTFRTPANAVLFVGIVSLGAIPFNLDFVAALINFGALMAFSFVNLTVVAHFAVKRKEIGTPMAIFRNVVLPLIGVAFTIVLWWNLSRESFNYGVIWFLIGVLVLLWITRLFRRSMNINMGDGH